MKNKYPYTIAGMMVKKYFCYLCGKRVLGFKDRESAKEFRITKTCQKCQDEIFKND